MAIVNLNETYQERDFGETFTRKMWALSVGAGDDMVEVSTEDGISTDIRAVVVLTNELTGVQYYHPHYFVGSLVQEYDEEFGDFTHYINSRSKATDFLERIQAAGKVDLQYWESLV